MLVRPGQTVAQFYPLELEETCTENFSATRQITMLEWKYMPFPEPPVWKQGVSCLLLDGKRSFTGPLEEYGDLLAIGDGNYGRTHLL